MSSTAPSTLRVLERELARAYVDDVYFGYIASSPLDIPLHSPLLTISSPRNPDQISIDLAWASRDPKFMAIDLEWASRDFYPSSHPACGKSTEIGLTWVDPRDLHGVSPGRNAKNWIAKIRARHVLSDDDLDVPTIVREFRDVRGALLYNAHNCEFADTEVMSRDKFGAVVEEMLKIPEDGQDQSQSTYRKIAIVGQSFNKDDEVFRDRMGVELSKLGTIEAISDNAFLEQELENGKKIGLASLMDKLKINRLHLHNGTNDAVYTLVVQILNAFWRRAMANIKHGDWDLMNEVFPGLEWNGEEAIQALKASIAAEKVGQCQKCTSIEGQYGHSTEGCDEEVAMKEMEEALDGAVVEEAPNDNAIKAALSTEEEVMKEFIAKGKLVEKSSGGMIMVRPLEKAAHEQ
jgi:hypothetical protein